MLAAFEAKKVRVQYLQALLERAEKLVRKYNLITVWLEKEIKRYTAVDIFESGLLKTCDWTLRLHIEGDCIYLDGRISPELSKALPGDWHYGIDYDGLRLGVSDNDVYLSGPIDAMRKYIGKQNLGVDTKKLNDTIDRRSVELEQLVRLRDEFRG